MHFRLWVRCGSDTSVFYTNYWLIDQAETVSRRVEKFAELMQSVWLSRNDYERRAKAVCYKLELWCIRLKQNNIKAPTGLKRKAKRVGISPV